MFAVHIVPHIIVDINWKFSLQVDTNAFLLCYSANYLCVVSLCYS
ncbi:hypothetical protein HMPREF3208_01088 [Gardnerella vaginalis]|uniref:Uncharacterized protein n=1 Tax=Gardnerella vaginalis TaxID=2702 RepID=A0A133NSR3_GARVA|nr:hypothetical protein HMPREF3208_01088 [Gardnerella vaginalis]